MAMLAFAACVPTEVVEVPEGIEWVAVVSGDGVPSRLQPLVAGGVTVSPDVAGWVVGFSTESLTTVGLDEGGLDGLDVYVSEDCVGGLPPPERTHAFGGASGVPSLSTSAPIEPRCTPTVSADQFAIEVVSIPETSTRLNLKVGPTDQGAALLWLSDKRLFRIGDGQVVRLGQIDVPLVQSIAEHEGQYWVLAGLDGGSRFETYRGSSLSALNPDRPFVPSVLHITNEGRLAVVAENGTSVYFPTTDVFVSLGGEPRPDWDLTLDVQNDGDQAFVAATTSWSYRLDGGSAVRDLNIRPPFARLDASRFLVGETTGALRVVDARQGNHSEAFADVRSIRSSTYFYSPIIALVPYANGVLAADQLGYVTYVGADGHVEEVAHLIQIPFAMYVDGEDIIVLSKDVSSQIFYGHQFTDVNVYFLRRR